MPNFIEVCAGAGGLSTGLIEAGLTPLLLLDNDKICCETLRLNHPDIKIKCQSITDLHLHKYQGIDLLAGGIPCQSFSVAGKRRGVDDSRGNLIFDFMRLIDECQPKMFLIENVKGLISHKSGRTFRRIIRSLSKKSYIISWKILNANDYEVPQKRERLFIIGASRKFTFPSPLSYRPVLSDALHQVPKSPGIKYSPSKRKIMKLIPSGGCWINLPPHLQK